MVSVSGFQSDSTRLSDSITPKVVCSIVPHIYYIICNTHTTLLILYTVICNIYFYFKGEHLQDIDVEPFVSKMFGNSLYEKPTFSFVRITSLKSTPNRLWESFILIYIIIYNTYMYIIVYNLYIIKRLELGMG